MKEKKGKEKKETTLSLAKAEDALWQQRDPAGLPEREGLSLLAK